MNFGKAIEGMKEGFCVSRKGWNGKGMHIYLEDCYKCILWFGNKERKYEPVICMYTAEKKHQPGWLASQADMLADDWEIVASVTKS